MNKYWNGLVEDSPWFVARSENIIVGESLPSGSWQASDIFTNTFPNLTRLLNAAHISHLELDDSKYTLFSWEGVLGISSWVVEYPVDGFSANVFSTHRVMLAEFGGIAERANDLGNSWLINMNDVLTREESLSDVSQELSSWWDALEIRWEIPIEVRDFYSLAHETNGNFTICHRETGKVLLFAHDHSFDYVTKLEGCPEYTLYRLNGVFGFVDWVEIVAKQWIEGVGLDHKADVD